MDKKEEVKVEDAAKPETAAGPATSTLTTDNNNSMMSLLTPQTPALEAKMLDILSLPSTQATRLEKARETRRRNLEEKKRKKEEALKKKQEAEEEERKKAKWIPLKKEGDDEKDSESSGGKKKVGRRKKKKKHLSADDSPELKRKKKQERKRRKIRSINDEDSGSHSLSDDEDLAQRNALERLLPANLIYSQFPTMTHLSDRHTFNAAALATANQVVDQLRRQPGGPGDQQQHDGDQWPGSNETTAAEDDPQHPQQPSAEQEPGSLAQHQPNEQQEQGGGVEGPQTAAYQDTATGESTIGVNDDAIIAERVQKIENQGIASRTRNTRVSTKNLTDVELQVQLEKDRLQFEPTSGPLPRSSHVPPATWARRAYDFDVDNELDEGRGTLLSRGAVSSVWKTTWGGAPAILKVWDGEGDDERFVNEVEITRLCQFPHVVRLFAASVSHRAILLERATKGDLRHVLSSSSGNRSLVKRFKPWAVQIVKAMRFVHMNNVIHFDLKTMNILVTASMDVKLCDFSHAVYFDPLAPPCCVGDTDAIMGSYEYTAPEVFLDQPKTRLSDVYSFGILLWEMFAFGETPLMQYITDPLALRSFVLPPTNGRPRPKASCPPPWKELMRVCWSPKLENRPEFQEILEQLMEMPGLK